MAFNDEGEPDGFQDFTPRTLAALHFNTIMEYGYFLAGEVTEEDLADFQRGAEEYKLVYEIRRDFDVIQINGYTFSSFGAPVDLPQNLMLTEYDGDVGMYLVQLKAPMTTTWWRALQAAGEVVAYYPENTYLVRAAKGDMPVLRRVKGVQHVSLYQPAYKVRRSLLTRNEVVEIDVEFDGDQDLDAATTAIRGIVGEEVSAGRIGRFAYSRLKVARDKRDTIARRPEVLWVEPALGIEFSGERAACVIAGSHDNSVSPPQKPVLPSGPRGYQSWLRSKGFCLPKIDYAADCIPYWPKVAVLDTGLDILYCTDDGYHDPVTDEITGICTETDGDVRQHQDINHNANHPNNCGGGQQGTPLDPLEDCDEPVITGTYFCSGDHDRGDPLDPEDDVRKQCWEPFLNSYDFSDHVYHGTAVASIIMGNPWARDTSTDLDPNVPADLAILADSHDFFRGIGIAPSARIIIAKVDVPSESHNAPAHMTHVHFKNLVKDTANEGARFANNSWNLNKGYTDVSSGYDDQYSYTTFSKIADYLVRDANGWGGQLKEMTIVFSAGNFDPINPYPPDPFHNVTSPANAKNVISVGATRGWAEYPDSAMAHPDWLPPIACPFEVQGDYLISDVAGLSIDENQNGQYHNNHSRRGCRLEPGSDTTLPRYKPDLVAPGTHLAAAQSRFPLVSEVYRCFGGTSGAAPAVTGSAVLAEAWYWNKISDPPQTQKPSPAMIKAMLVAHADSLRDKDPPMDSGTDHFDGSSLDHSPSLPQGWGRVNLDELFQDTESVVVYDQDHRDYDDPRPTDARRFTASGQYWRVPLQVDNPTKDLIAVMVFTDRFSQPGASSLKVNDLHLNLVQYGFGGSGQNVGHSYWGNAFEDDSWYSEDNPGTGVGTVPWDSNNTVEVIRVPGADLDGLFWVYVKVGVIAGKAIQNMETGGITELKNQDFALYVYNVEPWL